MSIVLQGDPYNLQGSSGAGLQPAGNPQQVYGPVPPTVATPVTTPKPVAQPVHTSIPRLDATGLVGASLSPYIGARPSPSNPGVAEFFRKDSGEALDQTGLFNYASSFGFGNINSFEQIKNPGQLQTQLSSTPTPATAPTDPNQSLARAAAQAGLSVDDFLKLTSGQYAVTTEEKAKINQDLGIPGLESTLFTPPSKTTQQIYQDAFNQAGLSDLKAKIADLDTRIAAIKQKYTDKQGTINENPFLSEASRTGRLKTLTDQGNAEVGNLIDEQRSYTDLYNSGINEVNNLVTRTSNDFNNDRTFNGQKLLYLQNKAEQQISDLQTSKSSKAYTYLPDYLTAKAKAAKPDTIGSAESGYFRWNPDTGTFEQVIAPTVIPNYQANPLTGELFDTKTGKSQSGSGFILNNTPTGLTTPAAKNNNPGNLRDPKTGAWQSFSTPQQGFDALKQDLLGKMTGNTRTGLSGDSTLLQFTNVYAPSSDGNNPSAYAQDLANKLGVSVNTKIGTLVPRIDDFAKAVAIHEDGKYAAAIGLTGSSGGVIDSLIQQVLSNPQLLGQLPDAQQKAVTARMAQLGLSIPSTKAVSDDTLKSISQLQTGLNSLKELQQIIDSNRQYVGPVAGLQALNPYSDARKVQADIDRIKQNIGKALEGGVLRKEDEDKYKKILPVITDTYETAIYKINQLTTALQDQINITTQTQGSGGRNNSGLQMPSGSSNVNLSDLNFSF